MAVLRVKKLLLLFVVGLTTLQGVFSQDPPPPVYRLPSTFTPQLYELRLEPDFDTGEVSGDVKIQISTTDNQTQTLNVITLHLGTNVTVNETTGVIVDTQGTFQNIGKYEYDDANTLLKLLLPEGQTLGYGHIYVISLQFKFFLNTEPKGLFGGYFNSTSKYVASNFRPTHAREVFPCFDEPQYKVPVALQVKIPSSYYAISTASLFSSIVTADDMVLVTFTNTEPISIHSLGLFISEQPPVSSMGVNVIVPPAIPTSVEYLQTTISEVTKQFGTFPLSPLNLVVLPDITYTSFSSFGFVFTSPEVYLAQVDSQIQWTNLQLQLTEEFLRQFLEYSKTPQWWSDIWLSESIGAYLSFFIQQTEPLKDWLNIVVRSKALGSYTNPSGPVITAQDLSKWDIENIISNKTVKLKGLSTLLMWSNTMPEGLVDKTIFDFLKLSKSVVSTEDLVSIMVDNIKANKTYNVTSAIPLLSNWLTESGSPLVWFSVDSTNTTLTLNQTTPCSAGSSVPRSISIALAEGSTPDWTNIRQGVWLLNSSTQYPFFMLASQASVINIESAPYRVKYEDFHWDVLIQALNSSWAPAAVASSLQDDAIALSLNGCLDFATALNVLNSSQHSSLEWYPVVKATDAIVAKVGSDWYGFTAFGSYFASLFSADLLDHLDVRKSATYPDLNVTRELVTPWLCRFNIGTCREAVVELGGRLWQGNTSGIAGSDLENVACYGARYTPGALGPLLTAYQNAGGSAWLKRYFTIALSCLTEESSVNDLLVIINGTSASTRAKRSINAQVTLSPSDAQQILIGLASNLENSKAIVKFILDQPTDIQSKLGVKTLSSVIKNLAKNRVDLSQLSSLQDGSADLDPYVVQSVGEAVAASDLSQSWWSNYSSQLYKNLPPGEVATTNAPATSTTTPAGPTPSPTSSSTSAPGGASGLSNYKVFTLILTALLIALDIAVH